MTVRNYNTTAVAKDLVTDILQFPETLGSYSY